ncbi:unnamed protein product, partial [Tilletia controversa]
MTPQAEHPR